MEIAEKSVGKGPLSSGPCYCGATFLRENVFNFRKKESHPFPAKQASLIRNFATLQTPHVSISG
jgi:hypothetical protein